MRRLLTLLPVVAVAMASAAAIVVSAGPSGAGAGTVGYTIYFSPEMVEDGAPADPSATPASDVLPGEVGPTQDPGCNAQLATVDLASGVVTPLSAPPSEIACAGDLAFAPDGTLYGLVQAQAPGGPTAELVRFDLATGAAEVVGLFGPFEFSIGGAGELPQGGLTFDATGTLYALLGHAESPGFDDQCSTSTDFVNWCLYRVDDPSAPGASTFVGISATDEGFASILAASCDAIYTSTFNLESDSSGIATVDAATGGLSEIGALSLPLFLEGADFDFTGAFWGLVVDSSGDPFSLATLDPTGGTPIETVGPTVTIEGDDEPFFNALAIQALDCTPEPVVLTPTFTG